MVRVWTWLISAALLPCWCAAIEQQVENVDRGQVYNDLQLAITEALPGETLVACGTFVGAFVIDKDILLLGENAAIASTGVGVTISDGWLEGFDVHPEGSFQRPKGIVARGTAIVAWCVIRDFVGVEAEAVRLSEQAELRDSLVTGNVPLLGLVVEARDDARVIANRIVENRPSNVSLSLHGTAFATRNRISLNRADNSSGVSVAGDAVFWSNLVARNRGTGFSGVSASDRSQILHNTIVDNQIAAGFHGIRTDGPSVVVRGNIVRAFSRAQPPQIRGPAVNADFNCIYDPGCTTPPCNNYADGATPGLHDLFADPQFLPGEDYALSQDSPCIDAGDPNQSLIGDLDVAGQPRLFGTRIDIGAIERGVCGVACLADGANADLDNNCRVDLVDLARVLARYKLPASSADEGDTNGDGTVDMRDVSNVLAVFGARCP